MKKYKLKSFCFAVIAFSLSTLLLSGCSSKGVRETTVQATEAHAMDSSADAEETTEPETFSDESAVDYASGKPWIYSCIKGVIASDTPTDLKEDYYLAVNKDEILDMKYQPGSLAESNLGSAVHKVEENKIALMKDDHAASHEGRLVHDYYLALDDWDTRTGLSRDRLGQKLEKINQLQSMKDYCSLLYDWNADNGMYGLFKMDVDFSSQNSTVWIAGLYFNGLLLGDSAEYTDRTDNGQIRYDFNKDVYTYALELLGEDTSKAGEDMDRLIDFEAKVATHTMTVAESNRAEAVELMDNYLSIDEIDAMLGPNFDFRYMLEANDFVPDSDILVSEPDLLQFYGEILNDDAYLEDIKNREKIYSIISFASVYSKESMYHVEELSNSYTGAEELTEYDKMLLNTVNAAVGEPLQKAYVDAYASKEMKDDIAALCREIADEYCEMLKGADWISDETRDEAVNKLQHITINSVYPEKWHDYSGLDISGMNLYEANLEIRKFDNAMMSSMLNTKIDSEYWLSDCTDTNAYYKQSNNSISILLGFLGDKTYTTDMAREDVLARIGAVIGHEISHAFDSQGGQYDADGNLSDWWTEEDKAKFDQKIQKIRTRFDGISIYEDKHLLGSMLDGEATADITGVECMLRLAEKDSDFDYDMFFRAYADLWAESLLPYAADYLYIYNVHAPNYLRVNVTLQQFDKFLETYDIQKGDGMYLAPEDRILVW